MTANPFRPAEQVAPKVKCLVYGPAGVGKTYLALTAPGRVAVIDTEGGTAFYANRVGEGGLSPFDVLPTKTFAQVEQAVAYLRANPGTYESLVIDPVTVLYETLQDAAQHRRGEKRNDALADLEMIDWQHIKRAYKRLMTDLVNLPLNVVVTARESDLTEERQTGSGRKERVKIGYKPDAEKSTTYYFDSVVRLVPAAKGREAIVEKDRTGTHQLNARVSSPTFASLFDKTLSASGTGARSVQSDEEAARIDATSTMGAEAMADRDETKELVGEIARTGIVVRGDGLRSNLEPRQTPDGYMFGFRLHVGDGKAIPQVVAEGAFGAAVYEALGGDVSTLLDQRVTVTGELYEIQPPGRRRYHRLVIASLATESWAIPAPETPDGTLDAAGAAVPSSGPPPETPALTSAQQAELDAL